MAHPQFTSIIIFWVNCKNLLPSILPLQVIFQIPRAPQKQEAAGRKLLGGGKASLSPGQVFS